MYYTAILVVLKETLLQVLYWDCQNKSPAHAFFLYGTVYENLSVAIQKKSMRGQASCFDNPNSILHHSVSLYVWLSAVSQ